MPKTKDPDRAKSPSKSNESSVGTSKSPTYVFVGMALDMSWRLAIVVLVPIIGGFKLDEKFDTAPIGMIVGFLLAAVGTGFVMKQIASMAAVDDTTNKETK